MIYLATPYSHKDPEVRHRRFEEACIIAAHLMKSGEIVFCPIAHTHPIAMLCDLPTGWDYWERYDTEMIRNAREVRVAQMDGWESSAGVAGEIEIAEKHGVPVSFIGPEEVYLMMVEHGNREGR